MTDMFALLIVDITKRDVLGRQLHNNQPLSGNDGRDYLREAYEEALDLAVYLRTALYERDKR